ncbi:Zinc finger, CCHC-type [Sesbania bispinosa]|nr:Zinc finger, CCHC-type [Sesbania bispinosa]
MSMASDNFVQPAIPRFDGQYDHWSMLMENFLRSKEYWQVIEYGVPKASVVLTDTQQKELEAMKLKDLKAKNYLFQAIDRSVLDTILNKETSKDIWESMKKKYQGSVKAKRQQLQALRAEFETTRMKSGESISDYFSRVMAIVNKMRINGDKTEEVTVVEKILRSLSPNFNFVVCAIEESKDIDELSLDELQSSLLVHEQKLKQPDTEEQALKASTNTHSNSFRGRGRGRGRGGRGNRDSSRNYKGNNDQFQDKGRGREHDKSKVECFRCHNFGHYASECYT